MSEEQINKILSLIRISKPTARENIRTLYLDRIGAGIIKYCYEHYLQEKNANVRNDLLRFTIQYARKHNEVIDFAKNALNDRSKKVRRTALSIFAFNRNRDHIEYLNKVREEINGNDEDFKNAINAIENQNHHLFYPKYDRWTITTSDTKHHLNKVEFKNDVELYIEKYAKDAVPELKKILGGNLY